MLENADLHGASPPPPHQGKCLNVLTSEGTLTGIRVFFSAELGGCSVAPSVKNINRSKRVTTPPPQGDPPGVCFPVLSGRRAKPYASSSQAVSV